MKSSCQFGECSTHKYCDINYTISSLPLSLKSEMYKQVNDTYHHVAPVDHVKTDSYKASVFCGVLMRENNTQWQESSHVQYEKRERLIAVAFMYQNVLIANIYPRKTC